MTKKRHAKLLRALETRIVEYNYRLGNYDHPKMYVGVKNAENGWWPPMCENRLDFWQMMGKDFLAFYGMKIKEAK